MVNRFTMTAIAEMRSIDKRRGRMPDADIVFNLSGGFFESSFPCSAGIDHNELAAINDAKGKAGIACKIYPQWRKTSAPPECHERSIKTVYQLEHHTPERPGGECMGVFSGLAYHKQLHRC
jgi:hypothetical protein